MKKLFALSLACTFLFFSACSSSTIESSKSIQESSISSQNSVESISAPIKEDTMGSSLFQSSEAINDKSEIPEKAESVNGDEEPGGQDKKFTEEKEYTKSNMTIFTGTYLIGRDLKEGTYTLTCLNSMWGMEVSIFEDEETYKKYHSSARYTVGEEWDAKIENTSNYLLISQGDEENLSLFEGNVVKIEGGLGVLCPALGTTDSNSLIIDEATQLESGSYVPGTIPEGGYIITASKSTYIAIFPNSKSFQAYASISPDNGEEFFNAIVANSWSECFLEKDQFCYINLKSTDVLYIERGPVTIEKTNPAWAVNW